MKTVCAQADLPVTDARYGRSFRVNAIERPDQTLCELLIVEDRGRHWRVGELGWAAAAISASRRDFVTLDRPRDPDRGDPRR